MGFLYSIPWVVSPVVAGFAWKWLLNDSFGIVNEWLTSWGIVREDVNWLGDPRTALLCVAVATDLAVLSVRHGDVPCRTAVHPTGTI